MLIYVKMSSPMKPGNPAWRKHYSCYFQSKTIEYPALLPRQSKLRLLLKKNEHKCIIKVREGALASEPVRSLDDKNEASLSLWRADPCFPSPHLPHHHKCISANICFMCFRGKNLKLWCKFLFFILIFMLFLLPITISLFLLLCKTPTNLKDNLNQRTG